MGSECEKGKNPVKAMIMHRFLIEMSILTTNLKLLQQSNSRVPKDLLSATTVSGWGYFSGQYPTPLKTIYWEESQQPPPANINGGKSKSVTDKSVRIVREGNGEKCHNPYLLV